MKGKKILFFNLVFFVVALATYLFLLIENTPKGFVNILLFILFNLLGVIICIPLYIFFHEFGHFVFGLATGYKLSLFRILFFQWKKDGTNKINFSFCPLSFVILGQCLMAPPKPKKKKQPPFYLYNAGGLIFSYLFTIIFLILSFFINNKFIIWIFMPIDLISIFLTLNNLMYVKNGLNDVSNGVFIKKNPKYIDSIMYQLEVISNILVGKRYGAKCKYMGYYENELNHISLPVVQFKFYQAIDHGDFSKAEELANLLQSNYHSIPFYIQKVAVIFDILYSDIVIKKDLVSFRRHFQLINTKMKNICIKMDSDLNCLYQIYGRIYENNYDIMDLIKKWDESSDILPGELLSTKKKFDFLLSALDELKNSERS